VSFRLQFQQLGKGFAWFTGMDMARVLLREGRLGWHILGGVFGVVGEGLGL